MSVEQLMHAALSLPPSSRALLAEKLFASLDTGEDSAPVSAEWQEELRRRCAEIDSGRAKLIPAEEVFAEARARLKNDRPV